MSLILTDPPPPQASPPPGSPSSQQLRNATPIREEDTGQLQLSSDLKMALREVLTGDERKRVCELFIECVLVHLLPTALLDGD